jgi:hypothetical protein
MKITQFTKLMCKMEAKRGRQVSIAQMAEIMKNVDRVFNGAFYRLIKLLPAPKR